MTQGPDISLWDSAEPTPYGRLWWGRGRASTWGRVTAAAAAEAGQGSLWGGR